MRDVMGECSSSVSGSCNCSGFGKVCGWWVPTREGNSKVHKTSRSSKLVSPQHCFGEAAHLVWKEELNCTKSSVVGGSSLLPQHIVKEECVELRPEWCCRESICLAPQILLEREAIAQKELNYGSSLRSLRYVDQEGNCTQRA
jgi:hypothetical protein